MVSTNPSLFDPQIYVAQLAKLRDKFATRRGGRQPSSDGVSFSDLRERGEQLCRLIADEVRAGNYQFAPLERVSVTSDGKKRVIHRANLLDAIVLGVLAQRLTALFESVLSDHVYAYRPGRNPQLAIERVQDYLAQHRLATPEVTQRGLFVLQRDLSAYGESIPTHDGSRLWRLLDETLVAATDRDEAVILRSLVAAACRPEVRCPGGETFTMTHGLPTGSPVQQPLANLYLIPLDRELDALRPGLYARFGDDVLILDPSPERAADFAHRLDATVRALALSVNATKSRDLYFTGPGRPFSGACAVDFRAASHVEYLGVRLSFLGRRGLKRKRVRELLQRSRLRAHNARSVAPDDRAVEFVAAALSRALHGIDEVADPATVSLRSWVDDRAQLRQLDYHLALMCAEVVSRQRGVRAFRCVPPGNLRANGLRSLLELRRRNGRGTP